MKNHTQHNHDIVITGIHLELTESLKASAREKLLRLIRHEDRIDRIRLGLEHDTTRSHTKAFVAKAVISLGGPDLVASVASEDLHKSLDILVDKLDRMLRRRSRYQKVKRNHLHDIDLPSLLPKVAPAA